MSDFGKVIKTALISREKTLNWLFEQVREKTGLYFDRSYYSKMVNGKCKTNPQITAAIKEILNI